MGFASVFVCIKEDDIEESHLYAYDGYFADDKAAQPSCVEGKEITAKLLSKALHSLPEEKRNAALLHSLGYQRQFLRIRLFLDGKRRQLPDIGNAEMLQKAVGGRV